MENLGLFGESWQGKIDVHTYKMRQSGVNNLSMQNESTLLIEDHLKSRFGGQIVEHDKDRELVFSSQNKPNQEIKVSIYFYDIDKVRPKFIGPKFKFHYKNNLLYSRPLYQYQYSKLVFYSLFNVIESEHFYMSVDFSQDAGLLIQISKFQSDVVNLKKRRKRLLKEYWKPTSDKNSQIHKCVQINFSSCIQSIIEELSQLNGKQSHSWFASLIAPITKWEKEKLFSQNIFRLFKNFFTFLLHQQSQQLEKFDIVRYLQTKYQSSSKQHEQVNLQLSYSLAQQTETSDPSQVKSVVHLYFYNYQQTKSAFSTQLFLFKFKRISKYKLPLFERQFSSYIFQRQYVIIDCERFFISIDTDISNSMILIQIGENIQEVRDLFRGQARSMHKSPKIQQIIEMQRVKVVSLEYIISFIANQKESILKPNQRTGNDLVAILMEFLDK